MNESGDTPGPDGWGTCPVGVRLVGLVFLGAGVLKLWSGSSFNGVVAYLLGLGVDHPVVIAGSAVVVGIEVVLGVLLLAGRDRAVLRHALVVAGVVLGGFTLALAALAMDPRAPGCGCLGVALAGHRARVDALLGIVRNAAMLTIVGIGLLRLCPVPAAPSRRATCISSGREAGFTLVEMLVVVATAAVILALLLPAVGRARGNAESVGLASTARQLVASTVLYTVDHDDSLPFFGTRGDPTGPIRFFGFEPSPPWLYFRAHSWHWASAVVPDYFDAWRDPDVDLYMARYVGEPSAPERLIRTYFHMTDTAFAAPSYWVGDEPPDMPSAFRPVKMTEMLYPSNKGLLLHVGTIDPGPDYSPETDRGWRALVALGDGSARTREWHGNDPAWAVERPYGSWARHVIATRGGFAGRDY